MKINGKKITGDKFAYDSCHKIYICEDEQDMKEAKEDGYELYDIDLIEECYEYSCELKFISNWKLDKKYARQFEPAEFEY